MRSNQLSYSPLFGNITLWGVAAGRVEHDFFFEHGDAQAAEELSVVSGALSRRVVFTEWFGELARGG